MPSFPPLKQIGLFLLWASVILVADMFSKAWALSALFAPAKSLTLTPFLNFVPVWNPGISFGLFADNPQIIALAIPVLALFVVLWLFFQLTHVSSIQNSAASFIAGGACGNVIDRFRFGKVVDFIDVHIAGYHWPAFNLADSALCIGVGLWFYAIISHSKG